MMLKVTGRKYVILALIVMTPGIPEYLTGSSSLFTILINPVAFFLGLGFNIGLYSAGALIIREVAVIFRKGFASILAFGSAYGIAEEGLSVHTFFETSGGPVGNLAYYGHYAGVNLVWALGLTLFHAAFSIGLPLLFLAIAFPQYRQRRLLGRLGFATTVVVYLGTVVVLNAVAGSKPTPSLYLLFVTAAIVIGALGFSISGRHLLPVRSNTTSGTRYFFAMGLIVFPVYVIYAILIGDNEGFGIIPPVVDMIFYLAACIFIPFRVASHLSMRDNSAQLFSFASGMVIPLMAWAILVSVIGIDPIAFIAVIIGVLLLRKLRSMVSSPSEILERNAQAELEL